MKKQQNKGFTLVEVLVAILVLAIITVPLLHSFITASRTNAKAKQVLKSTTLAQNVMEEVKAYSLEDIARQFNKNGYTSDVSLVSLATAGFYEAIANGDEYEEVLTSDKITGEQVANSSVVHAEDPVLYPEGVFNGQPSGEYHFMMENVKMDGSEFDVAIHLKESKEGQLVTVKGMNRTDCGYYAQLSGMNRNVAEDYYTKNGSYNEAVEKLTVSQIEERMSRKITISMKDDDGNQNVKIDYTYDIGEGYTWPDDRYYSEYITVFDNYASGEELKAVYLYYYPLYGSTRTDEIVIENNDHLDVDVYLIRMKDNNYNAYNDAEYRPQIKVIEAGADEATSYVKVCHNISVPVFTYNALSGDRIQKATLGNVQAKECMYDVTVEIFKHDSENPFDKNNLVNTFTGSILDDSNKN